MMGCAGFGFLMAIAGGVWLYRVLDSAIVRDPVKLAAVIAEIAPGAEIPANSNQPVIQLVYEVDPKATGSATLTPTNLLIADSNSEPCSSNGVAGTILFGNQPPDLDPIRDQTINEGDELSIPLFASDPNREDVLTFSVSGAEFCSVGNDGAGRALNCMPGFADAGDYEAARELRTRYETAAVKRGSAVSSEEGGAGNVVDRIVQIESGGDPKAKSATSSATGLGQFIDGTWIATIKEHRPDIYASMSRTEILALRKPT